MAKPFDLAVGEWWQVPDVGNSQLADVYGTIRAGDGTAPGPAIIDDWGGAAFDSSRGDLLLKNGGHSGGALNGVHAFGALPTSASYLEWRLKSDNSVRSDGGDVDEYPNGTPSAKHSYCSQVYDPTHDDFLELAGGFNWGTSPSGSSNSYAFDCATESPSTDAASAWRQLSGPGSVGALNPGAWPQAGSPSPLIVYDPTTDTFFMFATNGFCQYDAGADTWRNLNDFESNAGTVNATAVCVVGSPSQMWTIGNGTIQVRSLTSPWTLVDGGLTGATAIQGVSAPGAIYDPIANKIFCWSGTLAGGTDNRDYYEIDPATKVSTRRTGTGDTPTNPNTNGTYTRFKHIGNGLNVVVNSTTGHVYYLRTSIAPATTQSGFRLRNDDGSETTATWRAAENTNVALVQGTPIRVRFTIDTDTVDLATTQFQLEQQLQPAGSWTAVPVGSASSGFVMWPSANIAGGGEATTRQMATPSGKTTGQFVAGKMVDDSNPAPTVDAAIDEWTEMEFSIKPVLNRRTPGNETWNLRVTANGVAFDAYDQTPSLSVVGGGTGFLARKAT